MPSKVFISYRRDDSAGHAGRVHDRLEREFGPDLLFMDVDAIPLGVNFIKVLREEVAKCDVLLALIGPNWLNRRLDNPSDFLRIEIATALQRDIPVIPILLDGARMPKAAQLPKDLEELAVRNGLDIRHASFRSDMDRLIRGLKAPSGQVGAFTMPRSALEERQENVEGQAERQREVDEEDERHLKAADAARRAEEAHRRLNADTARPAKPSTWLGWAIGGAAVAVVAGVVLVFIMRPAPPSAVSEHPPAVAEAPLAAPLAQAPPAPVTISTAAAPLSPDRERALKPKDTFMECSRCPEMVVVPKGSFMMGSPANEPGRYPDEGPQHKVTITKPFAVSKFTLTFDNWDACVIDGGCGGYNPSDWGWGRGPQPVINVSWDDAKSYVAWLSKRTSKPYRLLTEAEYEYATRAGTQTAYWWGNDIGNGNANCNGCDSQWDGKQAAPVGSFASNQFGLYDMSGNVWEWVEDCWRDSYQGAPSDGSARTSGDCSRRVVRGGSWYFIPQVLRAANRGRNSTVLRGLNIGFRLARTLNP
jgi:formylglycine-generating enzyme required for sulfatase activity